MDLKGLGRVVEENIGSEGYDQGEQDHGTPEMCPVSHGTGNLRSMGHEMGLQCSTEEPRGMVSTTETTLVCLSCGQSVLPFTASFIKISLSFVDLLWDWNLGVLTKPAFLAKISEISGILKLTVACFVYCFKSMS